MSRYRWFQMVCLFCLSLGSLPSMAHVRWFAPEGLAPVALPKDAVALGLAAVVLSIEAVGKLLIERFQSILNQHISLRARVFSNSL